VVKPLDSGAWEVPFDMLAIDASAINKLVEPSLKTE
jgi:hypothetical protein